MNRFLLDTNVVLELRRSSPDPAVAQWFESARSRELYLSALTIGEIRLGILRLARRDLAGVAVALLNPFDPR